MPSAPPESVDPAGPAATPQTGTPPRRGFPIAMRNLRLPALVAVVICIAVSTYYPPTSVIDGTQLDASNMGTYAHVAANRYQFGTEVAHIIGPYAYVRYGWLYAGYLYWPRLVLEISAKLMLGTLLVLFAMTHRRTLFVWLWLPIMVCVCINHLDHQFTSLIFIGGLLLFGDTDGRLHPAIRWLACAAIAFAMLSKGTFLMLGIAAIVGVIGQSVCDRQYRRLRQILVSISVCLIGLWLMAGQNPFNLPLFFMRSMQFSAGYNASMGTPVPADELAYAGILYALLTLAVVYFVFVPKRTWRRTFTGVVLMTFLFVNWKHGFVRGGDAHRLHFYHWAVFLSATLWVLDAAWDSQPDVMTSEYRRRNFRRRLIYRCLLCACIAMPFFTRYPPALTWITHRFPYGIRMLGRVHTEERRLNELLEEKKAAFRLPDVRNAVKDATVDYFGVGQGIVILNELNYRPRPTFSPSDAHSRFLQKLNEQFILGAEDHPDYYLVKFGPIDGRFAAQEDALALNAILYNYVPLLVEKEYLLLKRKVGPVIQPDYRAVSTVSIELREPVMLPPSQPGTELFFSAHLPASISGRLLFFAYKPPRVTIVLHLESGRTINLVAIPEMLHHPVLVGKLIENNMDLVSMFAGRNQRPIRAVEFLVEPGMERYFNTDAFTLTFYKGPTFQADTPKAVLQSIQRSAFPGFSHVPINVLSGIAGSTRWIAVDGRNVFLTHASAEIRFSLTGKETRVSGFFGHAIDDYTGNSGTDGSEFQIGVTLASGESRQIYSRRIRPVEVAGDRGAQWFDQPLPGNGEAGELVIIFTTGPPGSNNRYDNTWISDVRIE